MTEIDEVVEKLRGFGLTSYEAKAFVTLIHLGEASAREISDYTKIPRTKVYDVLKKLAEKGFIEFQPGNPTLFRALEPLEVAGKLQKEMISRIKEFMTLVEKVKIERRRRIQHVWVSRGRWAVESKVKDLVSGAEKELLLFFIDSELKVDIPKPKIVRILLYEKIAVPVKSFRVIDREKLMRMEGFFRKYAELLDGYTFDGVKLKPSFFGIADGKRSVLAFREGEEFVGVTITIPMIVLLQKIMFESLWESFTIV
jgi:sugar-specific transcriptional regulator TrmB